MQRKRCFEITLYGVIAGEPLDRRDVLSCAEMALACLFIVVLACELPGITRRVRIAVSLEPLAEGAVTVQPLHICIYIDYLPDAAEPVVQIVKF